MQELRNLGMNPFPANTSRTHTISQILRNFSEHDKNKNPITVAGRLRSLRSHGNLTFAHLQNDKDQIR